MQYTLFKLQARYTHQIIVSLITILLYIMSLPLITILVYIMSSLPCEEVKCSYDLLLMWRVSYESLCLSIIKEVFSSYYHNDLFMMVNIFYFDFLTY